MSSDPENEYFSDGMTEEIINALSRIKGLKVTARTSSFVFKHHKQDVRKIGDDLGVSLVLEGSVRKAGDRVRITAQLIRTDNGFHIWSENFDRKLTDIFSLQDEISLLIAGKIREQFGHLNIQDHLVEAPTTNIEAYQLYLKGRFYHNKWNLPAFAQAAEFYRKSIEEDPHFNLPYFGAGLSYSFLGSWGGMEQTSAFELAESYFARGKQLQEPPAYGQFCMAKHAFWGYWRYKEAYMLLLNVYEIRPQHADTHEFMAEIYTALGDFPRALQHIETSLRVNPLSPNHFYTKANIFYLQGQFAPSLQLLNQALIFDPSFAVVVELKLACLIQMGSYPALKKYLEAQQGLPFPDLYKVLFRLTHDEASLEIAEVMAMAEKIQRLDPPLLLAWDLYLKVSAGQLQEAMDTLKRKVEARMGPLVNFKHDPFLSPLQNFAAFQDLGKRYFPNDPLTELAQKRTQEKAMLSEGQITQYSTLLLSKMDGEKYYLAPDLSLKDLAEKIDLHPNKLSWLLNAKLGKNFSDFVNGYRLKEFQRRALENKHSHLSLLGLAFESGFNSKSVFNEYFKKTTGQTPKVWLNQQ